MSAVSDVLDRLERELDGGKIDLTVYATTRSIVATVRAAHAHDVGAVEEILVLVDDLRDMPCAAPDGTLRYDLYSNLHDRIGALAPRAAEEFDDLLTSEAAAHNETARCERDPRCYRADGHVGKAARFRDDGTVETWEHGPLVVEEPSRTRAETTDSIGGTRYLAAEGAAECVHGRPIGAVQCWLCYEQAGDDLEALAARLA